MPDRLGHDLGERWPSDRGDRSDQLVLHQVHGLTEQEYLDLMPRLGEGVGMKERKTRLRGLVGAPSALDQHLHADGAYSAAAGTTTVGALVCRMPATIAAFTT